jgi:hypothetical protein
VDVFAPIVDTPGAQLWLLPFVTALEYLVHGFCCK